MDWVGWIGLDGLDCIGLDGWIDCFVLLIDWSIDLIDLN